MRENETNNEFEIRLSTLWEVLRRCWIVVLAVMIVVAAGAYAFLHFTHEDEYSATASVYVLLTSDKLTESYYGGVISNNYVPDIPEFAKHTDGVLTPSLQATGLDSKYEAKHLLHMMEVRTEEDTHFVYLTITSDNPTDSVNMVNALVDNLVVFSGNMLRNKDVVTVMSYANPVDSMNPSNPISIWIVALAALAVAFLVYMAFLIRFVQDDRIKVADDVEAMLGLNLLGVIPDINRTKGKKGYYKGYGYGYYRHYAAATATVGGEKATVANPVQAIDSIGESAFVAGTQPIEKKTDRRGLTKKANAQKSKVKKGNGKKVGGKNAKH